MRRGKDTADHEKGGKKRRRASEKHNMLCTGRDHVVLKGNRGGINRLEQSLMVDYGRDLVNFILSPYHFKVLKHFSVIEQLEIGQSREGVFNTWSA